MATGKKKHVVDLDSAPHIPQFPYLKRVWGAIGIALDDWMVYEHHRGGTFVWNPEQVALYASARQRVRQSVDGHGWRRTLRRQPVFNANLLDYLLAHPRLIPLSWKDKRVFFWGTLYRRRRGGPLVVRCLDWSADGAMARWRGSCQDVNTLFFHCDSAAVRVCAS